VAPILGLGDSIYWSGFELFFILSFHGFLSAHRTFKFC
jgi:hypothetical protein